MSENLLSSEPPDASDAAKAPERRRASRTPPAAILGVGLFFGLLLGWGANVVLTDTDNTESVRAFRERTRGGAHGNRDGGGNPHARDGGGGNPHDSPRRDPRESMVKVHFMKKFVAALSSKPANNWPSPGWTPLLKDGETLNCANCHDPKSIDIERMKAADPGTEAAEPFRTNPVFMVGLMRKWVEKLNRLHKDKLVREITCNDCHRYDPYEAYQGIPPLMASFTAALSAPPKNADPNPKWKPLLKDESPKTRFCAECHGEQLGGVLERALGNPANFPKIGRFRDDKKLMIDLMERWVKELNRTMGPKLRKAVVCIDCHATDPRR